MRFTGKGAVVTGGAVGIGRACAVKLASEGARVAVLDVSASALEAFRAETEAMGLKIETFSCDVTDEKAVTDTIGEAKRCMGKIDILVNNAAIWRCHGSFLETPVEEWKKYLDVNVMGVVYCTRAVLGDMIEAGYGRIINVASVAGVYGNGYMTHYSATKGALIAMTHALAKEVSDKGVLVNAVSPGSVSPSEISDMNHTQETPLSYMGRTGSTMENANLICFLASDEASYISGENILIDGCRKKM